MLQMKYECGFSHGAQQVRYVERHIYNRREFLRFHSDVGEFQALTELGRLEAEAWNKQKDKLEDRRAAVDTFCRYNYLALESFVLQWRSEHGLAVGLQPCQCPCLQGEDGGEPWGAYFRSNYTVIFALLP